MVSGATGPMKDAVPEQKTFGASSTPLSWYSTATEVGKFSRRGALVGSIVGAPSNEMLERSPPATVLQRILRNPEDLPVLFKKPFNRNQLSPSSIPARLAGDSGAPASFAEDHAIEDGVCKRKPVTGGHADRCNIIVRVEKREALTCDKEWWVPEVHGYDLGHYRGYSGSD